MDIVRQCQTLQLNPIDRTLGKIRNSDFLFQKEGQVSVVHCLESEICCHIGLLYGEGEQIFAEVFKDAWRGVQSHAIVSPGVNKVPLVSQLSSVMFHAPMRWYRRYRHIIDNPRIVGHILSTCASAM